MHESDESVNDASDYYNNTSSYTSDDGLDE